MILKVTKWWKIQRASDFVEVFREDKFLDEDEAKEFIDKCEGLSLQELREEIEEFFEEDDFSFQVFLEADNSLYLIECNGKNFLW